MTTGRRRDSQTQAADLSAVGGWGGRQVGGLEVKNMNPNVHRNLTSLMSISGPPGEEQAVAAFLRRSLEKLGVAPECIVTDCAHRQSEYGGQIGNLIVRLPGTADKSAAWEPILQGPTRMFAAHMDTVPGAVGAVPRIDQQRHRIVNDAPGKALGGDNRGGCAVLVEVARALCDAGGEHPPTVLVFFVQEEVGLVGARGLDVELLGDTGEDASDRQAADLSAVKPAMCFNFDGSRVDQFQTAVIGTRRFTINIEGVATHAGIAPGGGVSAGIIAAGALARLDREGWHGVVETSQGKGTANLGMLKGGTGSNVVMPSVEILAEARSYDPQFRDLIVDHWRRAFANAAAAQLNSEGTAGKIEFRPGPCYEAFSLPADEPVVEFALRAAKNLGIEAQLTASSGGCDANETVAAGIPTITLGVGQREVHTEREWLDLNDFGLACRLAIELATME